MIVHELVRDLAVFLSRQVLPYRRDWYSLWVIAQSDWQTLPIDEQLRL
jgi:hypothetical protein